MSAFYDIWISSELDEVPKDCRTSENPWQQRSDAHRQYFIAKPEAGRFYNEHEQDDYKLIVVGQFYETVKLSALLNEYVKYIDGTNSTLSEPAGHYIIFIFCRRNGHTHVFTNSFGTYHAYWLSENDRHVLSTYYMGLARSSKNKQLDWEGLTGFFGMGYFPLDKTYFKSIKILLPASHYHFNERLFLVASRKYRVWQSGGIINNKQQALSSLHNALTNTIAESTKGHRAALPLSGGLDSRTIAGFFRSEHVAESVWSFSYGYTAASKEIQIARGIAQACNMPFTEYVVPNYVFKKQDLIANSVELFQYIDGTRQAMMTDELRKRADIVVGGHWGDVWLDDHPIAGSDTLLDVFNKKIIKKGSAWLLSEIVSKQNIEGNSFLNDYFNSVVNKYNGLSDSLKFKAYKTDEWSFRWTLSSIRMYQAGSFPVLPFYDKNVADLIFSIAPELLQGRKLQIEYIKKFQPDLAAIKWQEYDSNLYNYRYFNNRSYVYRAIKKLQRMVKSEQVITRNWEVFYLNAEGRANLEAKLLNNRLLNEHVSTLKVQELISQFYSKPSAANGYTISMLHTFAQFLDRVYE